MSRTIALLFSIVCYAIFFATFLYLIAFVGDLPVPKTVDAPQSPLPREARIIIDVFVIALFGIQHSVMARPGFKKAWTRIVPQSVERSVYVLFASAALIVLFLFWQPLGTTIWQVPADMGWLSTILTVMFFGGFGIVLVSTFLINHFELFGLQQGWFNFSGRTAAAPELRQPFFYRWVAHPLYAGFFIAFWSTPYMTAGHLLLAGGLSIYMLIAIRYEERDLTGLFGDDYRRYRSNVGGLVPRFGRRAA
jgi:protein-S-isoprenylcysteine O-methyltransferase Ste14